MDDLREQADDGRSVDELQQELDRLAAENVTLHSTLRRRAAVRSFVTGALVVVTSLLLVAATVAVWGNRTVFDNDRFMATVGPALEDPALYESLSRNVSDQVIEALDLEPRIRARLTQLDEFLAVGLLDALDVSDSIRTALSVVDRPTLADLTPSIVDPLEERIRGRITGFITSEGFRERIPLLVSRAHEATLALLDGDLAEYPNVYVAEGEVRINLIPIIVDALEPVIDTLTDYLPDVTLPTVVSDRVGDARSELAQALDVQLPEDFGQLTVMSEDALSGLQTTARRINQATWALVILTAALVIVTLVVARNVRRTVIWLSVGVTTALAVSWWTIGRIKQAVLEQIAMPDSRNAIEALLQETTASFRTYLLVVLGVALLAGLVAAVVAHLDAIAAGGRWIQLQVGDQPTPANQWITAHHDALRVTGFVVAAIVLLVVGIDLAPLLVIGGLLGLYLASLAAVRKDRRPADPAPSEA